MPPLLDDTQNLAIFKDCLARRVLSTHAIQDSDDTGNDTNSAEQLDDFTSFLADQVWPSLPPSLRRTSRDPPPPSVVSRPRHVSVPGDPVGFEGRTTCRATRA